MPDHISEPRSNMTPLEAARRARDLEAQAELLPPGNAKRAVLMEANAFRALAEVKQFLESPKRDI